MANAALEASSDNDSFIWGCQAIASEIGRSERSTFHMLSNGQLPARKVGGQWVASRLKLRAFLRGEIDG